MLVGHFAAGMLAKRAAPQASLGTLTLAAMLADLLGIAFILVGVERWRIVAGARGIDSVELYDIALSHSLAMDLVWGAAFAGVYFWRTRYAAGAGAVFAATLSHWVFDVISHRPDMPLAPGTEARLGLSLWSSVPATLIVEGGLWVAALAVYLRTTRARGRAGVYGFWPVVILLTLSWVSNIAAAPPVADVPLWAAALISLAFFALMIAWTYWLNRVRPAAP